MLSTQTLHSLKLNAKQIPLDHDHDHDQIQDEDLVNQFTGGVFFVTFQFVTALLAEISTAITIQTSSVE